MWGCQKQRQYHSKQYQSRLSIQSELAHRIFNLLSGLYDLLKDFRRRDIRIDILRRMYRRRAAAKRATAMEPAATAAVLPSVSPQSTQVATLASEASR